MKKALIILTVLIILGTVGGVVYTTIAKIDAAEKEKKEYAATNPFPYEMPEVVMYPVPGDLWF